jgi:hypothetical protein
LPLFMKRHVLINFSPFDIGALSGTVTSAIIKALSSQALPEAAAVETAVPAPLGVPGVVVVDESAVDGRGVSVGRDKPGFVDGRAKVTKMGAAVAASSCETFIQAPRLRLVSRSNIQIFFMSGDCTLGILENFTPRVLMAQSFFSAKTLGTVYSTYLSWCCKNEGIEAVIIEKGIAYADFLKSSVH